MFVCHHPLPKQVFYISETPTGGSLKYIEDLRAYYEKRGIRFHRLPTRKAALKAFQKARKGDILLFQYLLNTDFTFADIVHFVEKYGLTLVVPVHDKYFLNDRPAADYVYDPSVHVYEADQIPADKAKVLNAASHVVFPSRFIYEVVSRYLVRPSMVVVPHMDERRPFPPLLALPPLHDAFHIGVITPPTYYKGADILERLYAAFPSCHGLPVRFLVYSRLSSDAAAAALPANVEIKGAYCESDIYARLGRDGVHGLLFLNRFPETYSYALTKGLNAGLPLLYSDMGAVGERIADWTAAAVEEEGGGGTRIPRSSSPPGCCPTAAATTSFHNQPANSTRFFPTNNAETDVARQFERFLAYIKAHAPRRHSPTTTIIGKPPTVVPAFYDRLFLAASSSAASSPPPPPSPPPCFPAADHRPAASPSTKRAAPAPPTSSRA
jgi:glycosyltransferase involved in cell wall biosynthesis